MKILKRILFLNILVIFFCACGSTTNIKTKSEISEKPVVIANDSLEYEITIIDIGFNLYLNSIAEPRGFYSQEYLEARNSPWVIIWNQRVLNPNQFDPNIYENMINYNQNTNYGYEVNYLLFNYFLFAQQKYKMSLGAGFRKSRVN